MKAGTRCGFVAIVGLLASFSSATPENLEVFVDHYKPKGDLLEAKCASCHSPRPPKLNGYGSALEESAISVSANPGHFTVAALTAIEDADSDEDGWKNIDEINAGTLPGDPASFPPGEPPAPPVETPKADESPLANIPLPKHGLHPVIVHFPIALFLFGALLDLLGLWKSNPNLRFAGNLNLIIGAISSIPSVATGLFAFFRIGFPWEGTALIHLILGIAATVLMLVTAIWRLKKTPSGWGYVVLLVLSCAVVGAAGHFGGELVFG